MLSVPFVLPVIDLAGTFSPRACDRAFVARDVHAAGCETGMFLIRNHDVPDHLIASHFDLARSFFALDVAEKRAIEVGRSHAFRGYEPFGTQTVDETAPGDLKEGFIMGPDLPPDHPHVLARYPNTGANRWPRRPVGFQRRMETYVDAMNRLGRHLARVLALSLDLPEDYFFAALAEPLTYSQLFHYPSLPAQATGVRLGAGAHVDWGMLTILLQDDVGGLEIQAEDARWHPAPPVPGTIVVILGEMMVRFTNGLYRSAAHRVTRNTTGRSRYSMPTFFDPPYDYRVACVPTCRPVHGEPLFPARTVAEHMREMASGTLSAAM